MDVKLSGHGCTSFWGVTPALDLISVSPRQENQEKNILICAAGDCRHVIKTIAKERLAGQTTPVNFFLLNSTSQEACRDLLLLSLCLESYSDSEYSSKSDERTTDVFLDLYGNLRLRPETKTCLLRKRDELIRFLAEDKRVTAKGQFFDLSHLRFKDVDLLEAAIKTWSADTPKYDLQKCWEARMRRDLEERYDSRLGAFDWDYSMKLCDTGASSFAAPIYSRWRETGIAFEPDDLLAHSIDNPTLVSGLSCHQKHTTNQLQGFWGDMVSSPFIAFGLGEDAQKYRKLCNKMDTVPSSDIAKRVLMDYRKMIFEGIKSSDQDVHQGVVITELAEGDDGASGDNGENSDTDNWRSLYKIIILPPGQYSTICQREKYRSFFDTVYIGGHSFLESISELTNVLKPQARLIFESPKYLIGLPKTRCSDYYQVLKEKFEKNGFDVSFKYDPVQDDYFHFFRT